jgi:hypothetical protein
MIRIKQILLLFFVFLGLISKSQTLNYNFTAASVAYIANAAPTGTVLHGNSVDDALSVATNIGFTFQYNCINYTQFKASSNGWLTFNTGVTGVNTFNDLTGSTDRPIIAPLWDDLATGTAGNVNYKLTGIAPNRILTIEWLSMEWRYSATNAAISFQCKLYETSNRIEFCYSRIGAAGANLDTPDASIGLSGTTVGDFYSLNDVSAAPVASKLIETTTIATKPATNQVYRWDPVSCSGTPVGGTAVASPSNGCATYTTNLSLTGASSGCGLTYQWQSATAIGGPYSNIAGATAPTRTVNNTASTFYRCVLSCGGSTAASAPATATITTPGVCGYCSTRNITLPYASAGQTTCGEGDDVTALNVTNICGSNSYYGGEDVVYSFTPTATGVININVTSSGSYMGLMLYNGCPNAGGACIGNAQSSAGNQTLCVAVVSGQPYYLIIDSWPSPTCNPFGITISASGPCSGSIAGSTAAATPTIACGTLTTNLTLSAVAACGPLYQWQFSTAIGGPYASIPSATTSAYTATTSTTGFFRCLLSCSSATAASAVVNVSVAPGPSITCNLSTYVAAPVTYSYETFGGTTLPTTDDVLFNAISLFGFPFCYAGQQFNGAYVASNSSLVFDALPCFPNVSQAPFAVNAAAGVSTGYAINFPAPSALDYTPRNAILAPWHDVNPASTVGTPTIHAITLGTAPNRRFIVSWESIAMYSSACETVTAMRFSGQVKLFENGHAIEIHIKNKQPCPTFNNGQAILGLHNYNGSVYVPAVNPIIHNATAGAPYNNWSMTTTAYRFTTPCTAASLCAVPLPIGFKQFYGQQVEDVNKLWWETSEELAVKEFYIERSIDAEHFTKIGTVNGVGKANFLHEFTDVTYEHGRINYYRVIAVENNSSQTATSIYPIYGTKNDLIVTEIYPNPTTSALNIGISGFGSDNALFLVYDQYGKIVSSENKAISGGMNKASIDLETLSSGIYLLEVRSESGKVITRQKFSKL